MAAGTKSIGQVLKVLKEDYADISISKIRFLEGEGLISPERAPSGYRRYSEHDIERLRYILDAQKNHYLPLKVIREHLDAMDAGEEPPSLTGSEGPPPLEASDVLPEAPVVARSATGKRTMHVTRKHVLEISGLSEASLTELEELGLVVPRRGTAYYGRDALIVAVASRQLDGYGLDTRHLRAIKQVAEREAALIEQAVQAQGRRRPASRQAVAEVLRLVMYAHTALVRMALRS